MLFTSKVAVVVDDERDAASVGFRLQFPLFQSNSYFPRGGSWHATIMEAG